MKPAPKHKRVVIALKMAGIAGQSKLAGIFRRLGNDHNWNITLLRTAQECTSSRIAEAIADKCDGFIVSIPTPPTSPTPPTPPTSPIKQEASPKSLQTASDGSASLLVPEDAYAPLARSDIPTVVVDIHAPSLSTRSRNIVFVHNSSDAIGRAAANHLLSTGRCRSYAFVHNPAVMEWSVGRFRAFRETLADRGLWCHELASPGEIRRLERPIGICAANDDCGYDVLEWCRAHRMRVPEDALVLGINNDSLICENCRPRLSSVQPDFEQEGYLAADALERLMASPQCGETANVPFSPDLLVGVKTVVRRESTAEISSSGKLVQRAVAYIRKNALKGIGAAEVVRHLGCSRRLADLRFRELQGTSIGEMLISTRLEEVKRLLRSTKEPIDTIAASCGFASPNYLKNLFKKRFNMSMRDFRRSVWK